METKKRNISEFSFTESQSPKRTNLQSSFRKLETKEEGEEFSEISLLKKFAATSKELISLKDNDIENLVSLFLH